MDTHCFSRLGTPCAIDARLALVRFHLFQGGGDIPGLEDIDQWVSTGARCLRPRPIPHTHGTCRWLEFREGARVGSPMLVRSFTDLACGLPSLNGPISSPRFSIHLI